MTYDFNSAGAQRVFDVLPVGTLVVLQTMIKPGKEGEDFLLTRTKAGDALGLKLDFEIVEGEHAGRHFFNFLVMEGTTDGHAEAADISRRLLRAILESAKGIKPTDISEAAKAARSNVSLNDFNGMCFLAVTDVEPASGEYKAKTIIGHVVTPEMKDWRPVAQKSRPNSSASSTAPSGSPLAPAPINRPDWARPQ
jgi:hypothetical protein